MTTILVVDDEAVDREHVARCLEPLDGVRLLNAREGAEALALLESELPDLLLTDLRMPGMDGLELVGRVQREFPLVPVILMTSKGSEQIAVQALEAGASSYVPKADLDDNLAETVAQVLEIGQTRRDRREVLRFFDGRETRFEMTNDISLINPLVGYLQDDLERLGLGDDGVRTNVGVALMESLSNAIIHGNLEVDSSVRDDDLRSYYELIEQRRHESPYAERRVRCVARETAERIDYVIEDEGPGFDHRALPDPTDPENLVKVRGRGLMLVRTFMDQVDFNDRGNRITMTKLCP